LAFVGRKYNGELDDPLFDRRSGSRGTTFVWVHGKTSDVQSLPVFCRPG